MKLQPRYLISIDEFQRRLKNSKLILPVHSNCVGTAFFLCGLIKEDTYIEPRLEEVHNCFVDVKPEYATFMVAEYKKLDKSKKKEKTIIQHVLIFHPFDPSVVYHRIGKNGPFMESNSHYAHHALIHYNKRKNLYVRYCGLNYSVIDMLLN